MRCLILAGAIFLALPANAQDRVGQENITTHEMHGELGEHGDHGEHVEHRAHHPAHGLSDAPDRPNSHEMHDGEVAERDIKDPETDREAHRPHKKPPENWPEKPHQNPPEFTPAGPKFAADAIWGEAAMAQSRAALRKAHDGGQLAVLRIDRLESRLGENADAYLWDLEGFYGGDIHKLWIKIEGEGEFGGEVEDAEFQALYSRAITPFFDLQLGARLDLEPETRGHLVAGVEGTAPYWLHIDAATFLSDRGDLTARAEIEYDQRLTQQWILQPRIEAELALQDVPERQISAGLYRIEPGLRLRYEIIPEFAPYIGLEYEANLGESADLIRAGSGDPTGFKLLLGLRAWF